MFNWHWYWGLYRQGWRSAAMAVIVGLAIVLAPIMFYLIGVEYPSLVGVKSSSWGKPTTEFVKYRDRWNTQSALEAGNSDNKVNVLTTLLEQDRAEIRFWQERLFAVSFLFSGAILAILWYTLTRTPDTKPLRAVSAGGSVVLCVFYLWFVDFAQNAILPNDYDLIGIQFALKLNVKDEYLKGQAIYKWEPKENEPQDYGPENLMGHPHFRGLVQLNVLLTIAAVLVLVLTPLSVAVAGRNAKSKGSGTASNPE